MYHICIIVINLVQAYMDYLMDYIKLKIIVIVFIKGLKMKYHKTYILYCLMFGVSISFVIYQLIKLVYLNMP